VNLARLPLLLLGYKLWRRFGYPKLLPINYVFGLTNACNSRCKICYVWKLYKERPELREKELTSDEFSQIFESIEDYNLWTSFEGGEPFLRKDIVEICKALDMHCKPNFFNIATNALMPGIIKKRVKRILDECNFPTLMINLSLDGIGEKHDEIRGVRGNFKLFLKTYRSLKELQAEHKNLSIGINTVLSSLNENSIFEIYDWVKKLNPDSHIIEVWEEREGLFNLGSGITPDVSPLKRIKELVRKDYLKHGKGLPAIIQAFRILYYEIAPEIFLKKKQVIPCYALFTFCSINAFGDLYPCVTLSNSKVIGNLREVNYDFKKLWFSRKANEIRKFIKEEKCFSTIVAPFYSSAACDFKSFFKVWRNIISITWRPNLTKNSI
jgi:radical SAM protein with 4Fe4S-binding SPASM domain